MRGFFVSWTSGCVISVQISEKRLSFLYGYVHDDERIEVYLNYLSLSEADLICWLNELRAYPDFTGKGRYTLRAHLRVGSSEALFESVLALFEKLAMWSNSIGIGNPPPV